ncbi:hypothetical protein, partial [Neobacillus citreus]
DHFLSLNPTNLVLWILYKTISYRSTRRIWSYGFFIRPFPIDLTGESGLRILYKTISYRPDRRICLMNA